ncbi:hypothetical protein [Georgenia sp. SYP-B2076]|uniref:hypothetical protein n=1 Tax=Georgenia sp. SYP-B2076 TaxID=2495881 RepID=UPI00197AA396|nr:hypothetical protein [Georgenia sp. SYP-B2076]
MFGDVVETPDGSKVTLVDVGSTRLLDTDVVRVWDVALEPGGRHPWHQHHNPYVVLSVAGSSGRMDWLDGAPSRQISEYTGGAVFRPVSPVHCLTNTGGTRYRNRLVELKDLGENRPGGVLDVGAGARSVEGEPPVGVPAPADGRVPVIATDHVRVWTVTVPARSAADLVLDPVGHVVAELDATLEGDDLAASVTEHDGGPRRLTNDADHDRTWFVVALDYLTHRTREDR